MACVGAVFVAASLLSLIRLRQLHWSSLRDALFLIGLAAVFVFQFIQGAHRDPASQRPGCRTEHR
ncbi:MAG: hypothetical protein ACRDNF_14540, partial [Streptosporangiaceae bacterium]